MKAAGISRLVAAGLVCAGLASAAPTRLLRDGRVLFEADGPVTFGAAYSENAVRATVVSPGPTRVAIRTGRKPARLFLGLDILPAADWEYVEDSACVRLSVPGGTSEIQLRFDAVTSLRPFEIGIPLTGAATGELRGSCSQEAFRASAAWDGPAGVCRVRLLPRGIEGIDLTIRDGSRVVRPTPDSPDVFLSEGASVSVSGPAPGMVPPLKGIEIELVHEATATIRVPKEGLYGPQAVVVEGEAFAEESGGTVQRSTEHGNTHGGGCIFAWADPGHAITWRVPIPVSGEYTMTIVGASAEARVLRSVAIDGQPVRGAGLLDLAGTGGWGRSDPEEWQAYSPADAAGRPATFRLAAGTRQLTLTNTAGHHFNIDAIVFTPAGK